MLRSRTSSSRLPRIVVKSYQSQPEAAASLHLIYSPWGVELFAGRLESQDLQQILDSPARKRLGKLLEEGNAAVLLLLTGPDEAANKRAEQAVTAVLTKAAEGEIPVASASYDFGVPENFMPDPQEDEGQDAEAGQPEAEDAQQRLKLALLKVARTDPKEQWLVRPLLKV